MEIISLVKFTSITNNLEEIKKEYEKYNKFNGIIPQNDDFFKFPLEKYNEIIDKANNLNKALKEDVKDATIKKDYDSLSIKVHEFYIKIKQTTFGNKLFNQIKHLYKKLKILSLNFDKNMNQIKGLDDTENLLDDETNQRNENHLNSKIYGDYTGNNIQTNDHEDNSGNNIQTDDYMDNVGQNYDLKIYEDNSGNNFQIYIKY